MKTKDTPTKTPKTKTKTPKTGTKKTPKTGRGKSKFRNFYWSRVVKRFYSLLRVF